MTAHQIRSSGRARRTATAHRDDVGERADDAVTNLVAYALRLDVEFHRLDARVVELAAGDSDAGELRTALRERDELEAQRQAYRRSVTALREQAGRDQNGAQHGSTA